MEEVVIDQTSLGLQVGEYKHINIQIQPPYASSYSLVFSSEDPSIAVVYPGGVIKGIREGTTRIIMKAKFYLDGEEVEKYTVCLVTVGSEEEETVPPEEDPVPPEPEEDPVPSEDDSVTPEEDPVPPENDPVPPEEDSVPPGPSDEKADGKPDTSHNKVPATGDNQFLSWWLVLMGSAVLTICVCSLILIRKRSKKSL